MVGFFRQQMAAVNRANTKMALPMYTSQVSIAPQQTTQEI